MPTRNKRSTQEPRVELRILVPQTGIRRRMMVLEMKAAAN
jgi:hypothetical protein